MARRTAKKKSSTPQDATKAAQPQAEAPVAVEQPQDAPKTDGATLLADLEKRCVALRTWHQEASATLEARETQINKQATSLAKQQDAVAKTHKQLNAELEKIAGMHTAFEADRQELAEMRRDLEAEWSALRNLRDAQAKLGHELDAERRRLNRRAFKITTPPASVAETETPKLKAA